MVGPLPSYASQLNMPATGSHDAPDPAGMNWLSALPCVFVYRKYIVVLAGRNSAGENFPSPFQSPAISRSPGSPKMNWASAATWCLRLEVAQGVTLAVMSRITSRRRYPLRGAVSPVEGRNGSGVVPITVTVTVPRGFAL